MTLQNEGTRDRVHWFQRDLKSHLHQLSKANGYQLVVLHQDIVEESAIDLPGGFVSTQDWVIEN